MLKRWVTKNLPNHVIPATAEVRACVPAAAACLYPKKKPMQTPPLHIPPTPYPIFHTATIHTNT